MHPTRLELEDHFFANDGGFDAEGQRQGGGPGLDAGQAELDTIAAHVSECAACQALVSGLESEREKFLAAFPSLPLPQPAPISRRPQKRRWLQASVGLAAALLLGLASWWVIAGQLDQPDLRAKGQAGIELLVQTEGAWLPSERPAQAEEVVRFRVTLVRAGYPLVLGAQDDGVRSVLLPLPDSAVGPGELVLPGATRLDDYKGRETAELWFAASPWTAGRVEALVAGEIPETAELLSTVPLRSPP